MASDPHSQPARTFAVKAPRPRTKLNFDTRIFLMTLMISLPGAMTGLILAGAAPFQAVLVQAVVMFLVLAATATTTTVIALGLIRRLFTPDHRLVYLPAPADH